MYFLSENVKRFSECLLLMFAIAASTLVLDSSIAHLYLECPVSESDWTHINMPEGLRGGALIFQHL